MCGSGLQVVVESQASLNYPSYLAMDSTTTQGFLMM